MKMVFIEENLLYKFKPALLASRVALKRNDGTVYIGMYEDEKLIGFAGYKILPDSIRLKTDYIVPECRGKGLYDELFKFRLETIRKKYGEVRMTAYCTEMSIGTYKRHGFKSTSKKNSITFAVYE